VPVKINAVLCAENTEDIPWLLEFCERRRMPLVLNMLRFEKTGFHRDAERHRLEDKTIRDMLRTIADATRTHPLLAFSRYAYETAAEWPDFTLDRLTRGQSPARPPGPRCSAGRFHCAVGADGRLYPCQLTVGLVPAKSILEDGLQEALKHAGAHDCLACSSPCMIEANATFALNPRILWNHLAGLRRRPVY
jgi:MoaA/NifB/PqqE/SkfB family radical SAM enzyme